jgi:hypothetical protein
MMQRLKLKKGDVKTMNRYDPLDLFSGSPERIGKALDALMDVPRLNFQLFRGGGSEILNQVEQVSLVQFFLRNSALADILRLQRLDF